MTRPSFALDMAATADGLQKKMEEKGVTIRQLSRVLGISFQAVHGYVKGKRTPNLAHFVAITQILDADMDEIVVLQRNTGE